MLTALILLLSVALVFAVGETVRGQLRRMLSRPIVPAAPLEQAADAAPARAAA